MSTTRIPGRYKDKPKYNARAMVSIGFGRDRCVFLTAYPKVMGTALALDVPGARFSYAYQANRWDGKYRVIDARHRFSTGMLPSVIEILMTGSRTRYMGELKQTVLPAAELPVSVNMKVKPADKEVFNNLFAHFYTKHVNPVANLDIATGLTQVSDHLLETQDLQLRALIKSLTT